MQMTTAIYFTRLSADEDRCFFPPQSAFIPMVKNALKTLPAARAIADAYRRVDGVELSDLFTVDLRNLHPELPKRYQTGLYACAALALADQIGSPIDSVGFYSGGATAAYLIAGAYDAETYLTKVFLFNRAVRADMAAKGEGQNLAQVLLCLEPENDIESEASTLVAQPRFANRVFVKDRRQPHSVLMAGYWEDLAHAVECLSRAHPEISGARLYPHRFAAHLPLLDHERLGSILQEEWFDPPNCDIVGSAETAARGTQDRALLRRVFLDGCVGPMNTGRSMVELARRASVIHVVGSGHGARVLHTLEPRVRDRVQLPPDEAVLEPTGPKLEAENPELELMQHG
jgi:hypothetical protein